MKTNVSHRIKPISLTLALLTSQLIFTSLAQADSPRSWGYWDAGPAAGPQTISNDDIQSIETVNINTDEGRDSNDNGRSLNNSQNTTRIDNRIAGQEFTNQTTLAPESDYVAYNICFYNCSGSKLKSSPETAGKMYIDVKQDANPFETKQFDRRFLISKIDQYNAELAVKGSYNDVEIGFTDNGSIHETTNTYRNGRIIKQDQFRTSGSVEHQLSPALTNTINGESISRYNSGSILGKTYGFYYIGKPVVATQIASQLSLGQTYQFSGTSYSRSPVNITVNFQKANWSGTWGANKLQNGFTAGGNITKSTLTSYQLAGAGSPGVGFVTGGKVNATLVGAIHGTDVSKAAVIGSTVVNVQQAKGTKNIGDIFAATASVKK